MFSNFFFLFFFFNDTATTEIYTLSLHDALPIGIPDHQRVRDGVEWPAFGVANAHVALHARVLTQGLDDLDLPTLGLIGGVGRIEGSLLVVELRVALPEVAKHGLGRERRHCLRQELDRRLVREERLDLFGRVAAYR